MIIIISNTGQSGDWTVRVGIEVGKTRLLVSIEDADNPGISRDVEEVVQGTLTPVSHKSNTICPTRCQGHLVLKADPQWKRKTKEWMINGWIYDDRS